MLDRAFPFETAFALTACTEQPSDISLRTVDEASFVENKGERGPLMISGGAHFCIYQQVNLGDNYMSTINADDGETYTLNVPARPLLNDGNAKNWEGTWKRNAEDIKNLSIKPLCESYVSEDCKEG
ncbi:MAG: hypothetical protein AAF222_07835 [Pseudomonadota bacterium]